MMTDLTIARYVMALLLALIAIPVLVQSLTFNPAKRKTDSPSYRSDQAVVRTEPTFNLQATASPASEVAEASLATDTRRDPVPAHTARASYVGSESGPVKVKRIDLREWRRMYDEKNRPLPRS